MHVEDFSRDVPRFSARYNILNYSLINLWFCYCVANIGICMVVNLLPYQCYTVWVPVQNQYGYHWGLEVIPVSDRLVFVFCKSLSIADLHHIDAFRTWIPLFDMDPDPIFHFDAGPHPDSTWHFDVDPDLIPAPNLRPLLPTDPPRLRLSLQVSIMNV